MVTSIAAEYLSRTMKRLVPDDRILYLIVVFADSYIRMISRWSASKPPPQCRPPFLEPGTAYQLFGNPFLRLSYFVSG